MEYRNIGRTGVKVSSLCLGTMSFGGPADEAESGRMFERALEVGVNFIDTANVYNNGVSEEILGRLMRGRRDELVVVSKVHGRMGTGVHAGGASRRHIVAAVEQTLKRLGTDRLDFYLLHKFDNETSIDETLSAFDELIRRGLILYCGASNWSAWQTMKALGISGARGYQPFTLLEPMYNLLKRQAEVEILPLAQSEGLGVISYSPLAAGLLAGGYGVGKRPASGRLVENQMYMKRYGVDDYYEIADRFVALAQERGVHPATLAVAWTMAHPGVTAPIIGARDVAQLEPSLAAASFEMTPELWAEVSALTPEVPLAHDRREEVRA
ncbi:MAG: aldo/keto reductase [Trueperaceae bacterium]|nr:aldo/keto reductase [Trueperaceae bacterium]